MRVRMLGRLLSIGLLTLPLAAGCEPGSTRNYAETGSPPDSLGGFWVILIAVLTFVVGFLVGATVSRNGGIRISTRRQHRRNAAGWNRVHQRVRDGTKQGLAEWRDTWRTEDPDWGDLSRRIEERILAEMHKHRD